MKEQKELVTLILGIVANVILPILLIILAAAGKC